MRFVDALLAFGIYLALQFVVGIIAVVIVAVSMGISSPDEFEPMLANPWMILVLVTAAAVAALSGAALVAAIRKLDLASLGLRPTSRRWLLAGLGVCAIGILVNIAVVSLYVWISGDTADPQAALMGVALKGSAIQFILMLLMGGVVVPIGEELLFRGILFAWLRRWGLPLSVILSSLVFGIFHGFSVVFFTAAILGAMLALLYEWSGSLWPPIIAHSANNLFSFIIERILQ
jgi:membrane protease YdiL (CAAX protease family)